MTNESPAVLQLLPALISGGVERGTVDIAAALVKGGFRAYVASRGGEASAKLLHELERAGATHIDLPLDGKMPWQISANARAIEKIVKKYQIDIIHARSRAPAWAAYRAVQQLRKKNIPLHFVTTFHGTYNIGHGLWGKFKRRYNRVMTLGDRVIAISNHIKQHIKHEYHCTDDKITTIPRGIDMVRFDPFRVSDERSIALLRQWNVPEHIPLILLPGRFTRWKGQWFLLNALAEMKDQKWFCVMMGSDHGHSKYRDALMKQVSDLGLEGRVRLLPDCGDMPAAYRVADVVVCPSQDPEAFGRVPVEAQAMGRMIVASNHGGAAETVISAPDKNFTGWLFAPHDKHALAESLTAALQTSDEARRIISTRGMAHVAENFTKQNMCDTTLALYNQLLSEVS
jgi:glycosyltransferase involved in cell wall biosynthesis